MPTVADRIVARLVEAGVQTLFGMPGGGSNLDLVEAAGRVGLRFVLSHTETAGALMASAQAELTGRPGACLATLGPGVASVVNGVAHAWLDRVPLVVLTDSMPASGRDTYLHQRLDHSALLAPVTKASIRLEVQHADEQLARALALANASPPGPVHVDLPADVSSQQSVAAERAPAAMEEATAPVVEVADGVRALLASARRPVVIARLGRPRRAWGRCRARPLRAPRHAVARHLQSEGRCARWASALRRRLHVRRGRAADGRGG